MKIIIASQHGFCGGVKQAISSLFEKMETTKKRVNVLGWLVHNEQINNLLIQKGVSIIQEQDLPHLDKEHDLIVITAHGITNKLRDKMAGFEILDTTCPFVRRTKELILKSAKEKTNIIYIGKRNHAEAIGATGDTPNTYLVESIDDITNLVISYPIIVINQTTLDQKILKKLQDEIISKYPLAEIQDEICNATKIRQLALNEAKGYDLCIVIGDKKSNNSFSLVTSSPIPAILISSLQELDISKLDNDMNIFITSSASAPRCILDSVEKYLLQFDEFDEKTHDKTPFLTEVKLS